MAFKKYIRTLVPPRWRPAVKHTIGGLQARLHKGNNVECPCCQTTFDAFLTEKRTGRPNAVCPRCQLCERHRLLGLFLEKETDFFQKQADVLHLAPEYPFLTRFKKLPHLNYTTADYNLPWVDVKLDVTDIQFEDNSYDVIICYHVLEHVPEDRKGLQELYRILRPGGWAIIQVPVDEQRESTLEDPSITTPEARTKVYGHWDHKRLYGRDFKDRLEEAGFQVEINPFAQHLAREKGQDIIRRFGLLEDELLYLSRKPAQIASETTDCNAAPCAS